MTRSPIELFWTAKNMETNMGTNVETQSKDPDQDLKQKCKYVVLPWLGSENLKTLAKNNKMCCFAR